MFRKKNFSSLCNQEIVDLDSVTGTDVELVKGLVREHQQLTGSTVAERLLEDWDSSVNMFVKVQLDKGQFVFVYPINFFFCDDHSSSFYVQGNSRTISFTAVSRKVVLQKHRSERDNVKRYYG